MLITDVTRKLRFLLLTSGWLIVGAITIYKLSYKASHSGYVRKTMFGDDRQSEPYTTQDGAAAAAAVRHSAHTLVIICANQRSGSSLTGEIFNMHPEVFYFYEPLISMNEWHGGRAVWFPWRLRHRLSAQRYGAIVKKSSDLIAQIHTCNYSRLVTMSRQHKKRSPWQMFVGKSKAIGQVLGCGNDIDEISFKKCGHRIRNVSEVQLREICEHRPFHVIKTVRLHVEDLLPLMRRFNASLKIIYLHRDPRAIVNSRQQLKRDISELSPEDEHAFCTDLNAQLSAVQRLPAVFQNSIMHVEYNDLVANMSRKTADMLRFVGLRAHPNVDRFINEVANNSSGARHVSPHFSTARKNSSSSIDRWRKDLRPSSRENIEKWCAPYMKAVGYR